VGLEFRDISLNRNQETDDKILSSASKAVAYPGFFFGGVQQIQFRIEGSENGTLGAVAPLSGVPLNLQMNETRILIWLFRLYIPWNWKFGSDLAKLRYATGEP
jgi:hypothetical protein